MQPIRYMLNWLEENANYEHYLFTLKNLRVLCPNLSDMAFKTLLSRAARAGHLLRICRGIYAYNKAIPDTGRLLYHTAALLRTNHFNYISLETVLSDAGVISQVPIQWICMMSSGRSNIVPCGKFGTIEFIHTSQRPTDVMEQLVYDKEHHSWRASVPLALRDMKVTRRNSDLIDWETANEFIR